MHSIRKQRKRLQRFTSWMERRKHWSYRWQREETLEKEQLAAEKRLQEQIEAEAVSRALDQDQKTNDQQNAINMENQGNELLAQGSYESAITFYRVAQASYKQLGLTELADGIDKKMEAAQAGIAAKEAQAAEAEKQKSE